MLGIQGLPAQIAAVFVSSQRRMHRREVLNLPTFHNVPNCATLYDGQGINACPRAQRLISFILANVIADAIFAPINVPSYFYNLARVK